MKYLTFLAGALALPYLASASIKCTATSQGCFLAHPDSSCTCIGSSYEAGAAVYPECNCVTNGINYYADESDTWVEAHHFDCGGAVIAGCSSCTENQC